jgi:hypothetical protein
MKTGFDMLQLGAHLPICEILDSHCSKHEDYRLLDVET